MRYDKVKKNAPQLLSLTGLSVEDFAYLLPFFKDEWDAYSSCFTLEGKPRHRISYNRKNSHLPMVGLETNYCSFYLI